MTLTDTVREALKSHGASVRRLSLDTGITRATIKAFLDGASVNSNTLDKLAEYLGVTVTVAPAAPKSKRKKPDG